mmetsp:Transcript_33784/g.56484  ORF Transcript_33784/g.56484 Transcript_33784/m.56484 type:complete len:114 (+) Transcript_33784:687-1028(+)
MLVGSYRSPEEYAGQHLTPQIDIFSLGHVLFEIWTGTSPWNDTGGKRIRQNVQEGKLPPKLQKLLDDTTNLNQAMGQLIADCYRVDPQERITADGLVEELTRLLEAETRIRSL